MSDTADDTNDWLDPKELRERERDSKLLRYIAIPEREALYAQHYHGIVRQLSGAGNSADIGIAIMYSFEPAHRAFMAKTRSPDFEHFPHTWLVFSRNRLRWGLLDHGRTIARTVRAISRISAGASSARGAHDPTATEALETVEVERLVAAVKKLRPDDQLLIAMKYLEGLTERDIASIIGRTQSTVNERFQKNLRTAENPADVERRM